MSWSDIQMLLLARMPLWIEIGISLLIVLAFWLLRKIFSRYIFKVLLYLTSHSKTKVDQKILYSFERPLQMLITVIGFYLAFKNLFELLDPATRVRYELLLTRFLRSFIVVFIAWGVYNLSESTSVFFEKIQGKLQLEVNQVIIPLLSRGLRIIVIAITGIIILQEWDYDINGFVAGLGLGGLAFALAAQDTIANIFGGIVIIADKPFSIGDWIKTSYGEGTVEEINLRNTRIRTFEQALITVPNSSLAKDPIVNWSKMGKRRITFRLRVVYETPREKLESCIAEIREMLQNHPEVHKETIFVFLESFSENGFDIFIYFFTITTVWREHLQVREDVNYRIINILEKHSVSIALPSTSIYLEKPVSDQDSLQSNIKD